MSNIVDNATLRGIFKRWLAELNIDLRYQSSDIDRASLRWGTARDFDLYVWGCGGRIVQENGKRHLDFFEEHDLIVFLLRWS